MYKSRGGIKMEEIKEENAVEEVENTEEELQTVFDEENSFF